MDVATEYLRRFDPVLRPLSKAIESQLAEYFCNEPRIDRVQARAKSPERFIAKAGKMEGEEKKYSEPIHQIQDQIGARVVTFYLSDIDRVSQVVEKYYRPVEARLIVPDSEWEFGYFGKHYVLLIPTDVIDPSWDTSLLPEYFELQIKTLFQHAWSEADHDLGYKPRAGGLSPDEKRRLAFTSAQAWGADRIFDEIYNENLKR